MVRNAWGDRDRADVDVAVIDVPAVLAFWIAAAGELRHGPMIPPIASGVKPLGVVVCCGGNAISERAGCVGAAAGLPPRAPQRKNARAPPPRGGASPSGADAPMAPTDTADFV